MTSPLDRRVRQLEKDGGDMLALVWRELDQTDDEAIGVQFPEGVPAGVRLIVVGWMTPATAEAQEQAKIVPLRRHRWLPYRR